MLDPASPRPLYLQLADYFRRQIDSGVLKPNDRLPPEVELAEQFALSRGTVRQALHLLVSQGLLQRTAGKGTFVTGQQDRPRSQLIGIVVPYLRDSLTIEIVRGAESVLRQSGYSLIFCHSEGDLELERAQIERLQREGVSGIILFPLAAAEEPTLINRLVPPHFPLVLIDRRLPGVAADAVMVDNLSGGYRVVEHLLGQGHRRIVCVSPPDQASSVADRIRGYEQAMRHAGLLPLAAVPLRLPEDRQDGDGSPPSTADLVPIDALLRLEDRPTALFCINDLLALGVMCHVLARGMRVPHDIAIAGFDDITIAPYTPVPLTTVAQPKYEIGARAAELLLARIAGKSHCCQEIVLPVSLVVRASTALPSEAPESASFTLKSPAHERR